MTEMTAERQIEIRRRMAPFTRPAFDIVNHLMEIGVFEEALKESKGWDLDQYETLADDVICRLDPYKAPEQRIGSAKILASFINEKVNGGVK